MKKIMFNDKYGLTEAVLNGRKTQTRRIITPQPTYSESTGISWKGYSYGIDSFPQTACGCYHNFSRTLSYNKDFKGYKFGEVIAIAQSYKSVISHDRSNIELLAEIGKPTKGYHNKMFVKAELMHHQIRITNIRVERLQDISDADCMCEGISYVEEIGKYYFEAKSIYRGFYFNEPQEAFAALIDKVGKKGTWSANPYVFVYDFELIK